MVAKTLFLRNHGGRIGLGREEWIGTIPSSFGAGASGPEHDEGTERRECEY
jgi:hypothetical protein